MISVLVSQPNPDGKIRPEYYGNIVEDVLVGPNVIVGDEPAHSNG